MTTLADIYKSDYRVRYKNCLRQLWKYEKVWSCIGNPKESCILLYLDGCSAEYTLKDGTAFTAKSGSVVFCPKGSEYSVEFFDFSDNPDIISDAILKIAMSTPHKNKDDMTVIVSKVLNL